MRPRCMAARQFGFVVARGLAIYCWFNTLWQISAMLSIYLTGQNFGTAKPNYLPNTVVAVVLVLLGAFLWTTAESFAGPAAEEAARVQSGEWIVKLAFSVVGLFIVVGAVSSLTTGATMIILYRGNFNLRESGPQIAVDTVRFIFGLWLVLTNRFTRYRIADTPTSQFPSIPD